jgi:hypothetical protein
LIRDTHKPAGSATPLFEPLQAPVAAAAAATSPEPVRPFPMAPRPKSFDVPVASDRHHDQQQEDYLWGV